MLIFFFFALFQSGALDPRSRARAFSHFNLRSPPRQWRCFACLPFLEQSGEKNAGAPLTRIAESYLDRIYTPFLSARAEKDSHGIQACRDLRKSFISRVEIKPRGNEPAGRTTKTQRPHLTILYKLLFGKLTFPPRLRTLAEF